MSMVRRISALLLGGMFLVCPTASAQQDTTAWGHRFSTARALLVAGNTSAAESIYLAAIDSVPASDREHLATAHFGRAAAVQIRVNSGDSSTPIDSAIVSYEHVIALNTSLRSEAQYNLGLIFRGRADHAEAIRRFSSAQRGMHGPARAAIQMEIAREYEATHDFGNAAGFYGEALASDTTSREALRDYFRMLASTRSANAMLQAIARWGADSSRALLIAPALPVLLTREADRPDDAQSRRVLRSLTTLLTTGRAGPPWFADNLRDQLVEVAAHSRVREGARNILTAFAAPPRSASIADPTPPWWRESYEDRAAWSSLQRWLGDWYYAQDRLAEARSYYETAIGNWQRAPEDPSVDRKAVLPLTLIYAQMGDEASAERAQANIDAIFSAKAIAYERNKYEDIRDLHAALGAYYAAKGKWSGGGAQNAEYQLSRMRQATERLTREGKQVQDPPQLLASLAQHYQQTGNARRADTIKADLRRVYLRQGKAGRADSLITRIEQPTPIIRTRASSAVTTRVPSKTTSVLTTRPESSASPPPNVNRTRMTSEVPRATIVVRLLDSKTNNPVTAKQAFFRVDDRDTSTVALEGGTATVSVAAGMASLSIKVTVAGYAESAAVQARRGETTVVRLSPGGLTRLPRSLITRPPDVR